MLDKQKTQVILYWLGEYFCKVQRQNTKFQIGLSLCEDAKSFRSFFCLTNPAKLGIIFACTIYLGEKI